MRKIKEFQYQYGLEPDGVIGKKTLLKIKEVLNIETDEQLANFMGQIAHETGDFTLDTENLNYSAAGLLKTFKKYFNSYTAKSCANKPKLIANIVYSNRMGNGDSSTNDGWLYRGQGALQLTGKSNFKLFSDFIGVDCVKDPTLVATYYFFESAKFYFNNNKLWDIANSIDEDNIIRLSKAINLGSQYNPLIPNGLEDRIKKTKEFYKIIKK